MTIAVEEVSIVSAAGGRLTGAIAPARRDPLFQTISSGIVSYVTSGASSTSATVLDGGEQYVSFGGEATATRISDGGKQLTYGNTTGTDVLGGALEIVESGGYDTVASVRGVQSVAVAGFATSATIYAGGHQVDFGLTQLTVLSAGYEGVARSAEALATDVLASGVLHVDDGGGVVETTIGRGGLEVVFRGGSDTDTVVSAGGSQTVIGSAAGDSVNGRQTVSSGGVALGDLVASGASVIVAKGGLESGATISAHGSETVFGVASDAMLQSGGQVTVSSGGEDSGASIAGVELNAPGGSVTRAIVYAGGELITDGDNVYVTLSGGDEYESGGATVSVTVAAGGTLEVGSGASAQDGIVGSGGHEVIDKGAGDLACTVETLGSLSVLGVAHEANISGAMTVLSSGLVNVAAIEAGAVAHIYGSAITLVLSGSGAKVVVESGGSAYHTLMSDGGSTIVEAGGEASTGVVGAGGSESVFGTTSDTLVDGGLVTIGSAGDDYDATILSVESVAALGSVQDAAIASGGKLEIGSAGAGLAATVSSGGLELIDLGGKDVACTVDAAGTLRVSGVETSAAVSGVMTVLSGGLASASTIVVGAMDEVYGQVVSTNLVGMASEEFVESGGSATSTIVGAQARQYVESGGTALADAIGSDGSVIIEAGGVAASATVASGGSLTTFGAASGVAVASGGTLIDNGRVTFSAGLFNAMLSGSGTLTKAGVGTLVLSGVESAFSGHLVISAGAVELATPGGVGASPVFFEAATGPATLVVDAADAPAAGAIFASPLEDFDQTEDAIDLASIAFVSGAAATVSGSTLVLAEGGHTYHFKVGGALGSAFTVIQDSGSGTLIAPTTSAQTTPVVDVTPFFQTISSGVVSHVKSGGTSTSATVLNGGEQYVSNGGEASATTIDAGGKQLNYGQTVGTQLLSGGLELVESGGNDVNAQIRGIQSDVLSSFVASATVYAGGHQIDYGLTDATVLSAGYEGVANSAEALTTEVLSGGVLHIDAGGQGVETTVGRGGAEVVFSGGSEAFGLVSSGGSQTVLGSTDEVTVAGRQVVSFGGVASASFVSSGGSVVVESGGQYDGATVEAGGSETLSGLASSTLVESGGQVTVSYGGYDSAASLLGIELVEEFSNAAGATVYSGGELIVYGQTLSSTLSGGIEELAAGANGGGDEIVTYIADGGALYMDRATSGAGNTVGSGGLEVVKQGAWEISNTVVDESGTLEVFGTATLATVSGGRETVYFGGSGVSDAVEEAGRLVVSSGGVAIGAMIEAGGADYVDGIAVSNVLSGDGAEELVESGGVVSVTTVGAQARQYVESGGTTFDTLIRAGGVEVISAGGSAVRASLDGGEYLYGAAVDTEIGAGGLQRVELGGLATGATVASDGEQLVSNGGAANDTVVTSGGALVDDGRVSLSADTFAGTLTGSGTLTKTGAGVLLLTGVESGFGGHLVIDAGSVELATSGGLGVSPIYFEAGSATATLVIDAPDAPAAGTIFADPLEDFDQAEDAVDLTGLAFVSGATATASGASLVLSDGGHTYHFKVGGALATTFTVAQDAGSGTLITAGATTQVRGRSLIQAMAGFGASDGALAGHAAANALSLPIDKPIAATSRPDADPCS